MPFLTFTETDACLTIQGITAKFHPIPVIPNVIFTPKMHAAKEVTPINWNTNASAKKTIRIKDAMSGKTFVSLIIFKLAHRLKE